MSYQEMNDLYRDGQQRGRMEMCIRQEGYKFAADGRPDIAALARGVTAGNMVDIDALVAGVCVANTAEPITDDDQALLSAVDGVWPSVAAARYPQDGAS